MYPGARYFHTLNGTRLVHSDGRVRNFDNYEKQTREEKPLSDRTIHMCDHAEKVLLNCLHYIIINAIIHTLYQLLHTVLY